MKNVCTILFGLILTVCFAFYGTFGMAKAGTGAVFSIEICANGVMKTVLMGADGNPVEPDQNCLECLTCCQATGVSNPSFCAAAPSFVLQNFDMSRLSVQGIILNKRNILPKPRGPPGARSSMHDLQELIAFYLSITSHQTQGGERPLFKDVGA